MTSIAPEIIKEIAQYLESGMKCFYHIPTGNLEYYPDDSGGYGGFDEEIGEDVIKKVEKNFHSYIPFENMESRDSFRLLESFISSIAETDIRSRFEDAIGYRKPFQNFNQLLLNYPDLRQQWFDFKNKRFIDWVQKQLDLFNSSQGIE